LTWENVQNQVIQTPKGFVVFDDTVADKNFSHGIELVRRQYSGNSHRVIKDNRQVDDSGGSQPYQRVDSLAWTEAEKQHGKVIKIKGFPGNHKVKLFRVVLSTKRTDYVVSNDMAQDDTQAEHKVGSFRWKVEQFHRETKQLTGLEG